MNKKQISFVITAFTTFEILFGLYNILKYNSNSHIIH